MGDGISGIAVHIGARVCALAGPGEVLTTSTVRDLVAGSGLTFTDHGQHTLKGIPANGPSSPRTNDRPRQRPCRPRGGAN